MALDQASANVVSRVHIRYKEGTFRKVKLDYNKRLTNKRKFFFGTIAGGSTKGYYFWQS
jgi:hypothetical protein